MAAWISVETTLAPYPMKRAILKLVIAIFTALSLFALYLLVCFPILNTKVFSWEDGKGAQKNETQIPGDINNSKSSASKIDTFTFDFENPVIPEISDYIIVSITAKNTGPAKYPYGSIAINLSEEKIEILNGAALGNDTDAVKDIETDDAMGDKALSENSTDDSNAGINTISGPGIYKIQERARIFVDGIRHTYYIPVGENKYWWYDWNLDGPTMKERIDNLEIEIPRIEGVEIQINSVSLNRRLVFAADSHINYFFKNYFQLSYIDRYQTPAYVFLILFSAVFFVFRFLLNKEKFIETSIIKNNKFKDFKINFKTLALLIPLLLLIFFSFYFISNYIFTVKGYWDSYKQYIISGRLDETYYGFYDFKKFVTWVDGKVPEGKNIIVLVKGEPIYIMAQMAYGLYPKDIKFIDISRMSAEEIADKITSLNFAESPGKDRGDSANIVADKNNAETNNAGLTDSSGARAYEYIIVFLETDKEFLKTVKVKLEYSYRENAGFIYRLILK
jgi:hypothetical protein